MSAYLSRLHGQNGRIQDFLKAGGWGGGGVEILYHYEIHKKLVPSEIGVIGRGAKGLRGV